MANITLVTGGARSGKSAYAARLALSACDAPVYAGSPLHPPQLCVGAVLVCTASYHTSHGRPLPSFSALAVSDQCISTCTPRHAHLTPRRRYVATARRFDGDSAWDERIAASLAHMASHMATT